MKVSSVKRFLYVLILCLASTSVSASPGKLYLLHCSGCHLPDGRGVPPEVPTVRDELGRLIQIPGGRDYIIRVPGASQAQVTDKELAEVLNYMLTEFNRETLGSDFEPLKEEEVMVSRPNILADPIKYREMLWQSYKQ